MVQTAIKFDNDFRLIEFDSSDYIFLSGALEYIIKECPNKFHPSWIDKLKEIDKKLRIENGKMD